MRLRIWLPLLIVLVGIGALFFYLSFDEARNVAIADLNNQQFLLARQAAVGIEWFFANWTRTLLSLARMDEIVNLDENGKRMLEVLYESHQDQIRSVTRTNAAGMIVFTYPRLAGGNRDISSQKHVREIMTTHQPVVSDVFRAVQGFDAVAVHVPVLKNDEYDGSIAITVNFQVLAKRFFDNIKVGQVGHAWVISRDGTELFSPVPGRIGRSVFSDPANSPSALAMVRDMLQQGRGSASYYVNGVGRAEKRIAFYMPINLGNTFWSVAVSSSERDGLASLATLRNRLSVVAIAVFLAGVLLSVFGVKAWVIVREAEKRRAVEQEQQRLQNQLHQAMKMESIGRLAGGVAHDFNNLLTGIMGNLSLAFMDAKPDNPLLPILQEMQGAVERAADLTRQLLAFSRKQIIEPRVLNLNDLVANLQNMLIRLLGEDVVLKVVPANDLGLVLVDPGQFEQVIVNLAVNARDAMPDGGTIVIETANVDLDAAYCDRHQDVRPGRYVMLAVSDTGEGMNPEVRKHIFEPFFTTKPKGVGTGLGLATAFGAVKQAGGSIEVYSEVGKGTTFKLYLPRVYQPREEFERKAAGAEMPRGSETILIVEDEPMVREPVRNTLSRLGYYVLVASNGPEALSVAQEHSGKIDLLLTDVVMPGMNGRELADKLRESRPATKVLFTSGYTENVIVHQGVLDPDVNFISKPHTPPALARKIREVLDHR